MGLLNKLLRLPGENGEVYVPPVEKVSFERSSDDEFKMSVKVPISPKAEEIASRILLEVIAGRKLSIGRVIMKKEGGILRIDTAITGEEIEEELCDVRDMLIAGGYVMT